MATLKAFYKMELKALSREKIALFFMIVLPVVLTVVFGGTFGSEQTQYGEGILGIDTVVPVNIVFLIANTGLMGIPITLIELKVQGVIKRYITYPTTYKTYFSALVLAFAVVSVASTFLFSAISFFVYNATWRMDFSQFLIFLGVYFLIIFIFDGIGFLIALLIKAPRTAQLVASGSFMILLFTSGVSLPVEALPIYVQRLAHMFPMYHAIEVMQMLWVGEFSFAAQGGNILYLVGSAVLLYFILRRVQIKWG